MENQTKLVSFGTLFKSAWKLYKSNWKKLIYLFLPIEVLIVLCFLILDIISEDDAGIVIALGLILSIVSFVAVSFRKLLVIDAPVRVKDIELEDGTMKTSLWYKSIIKKIIPVAWILFLVGIINFTFVLGIMAIGGITFVAVTNILSFAGNLVSVEVVVAISLLVLAFYVIIKFFVNSVFAVYVYVFEGRRGLDAIASSFLLTSKRQFKIFWRIFCIWFVTALPFLFLLSPIASKIVFENIDSLYMQVFILHQEPVLPEIPVYINLIQDVLMSISALISIPFLVVLRYFLWKDIKATSVQFEEVQYLKTRKRIKIMAGVGIVVILVGFIISMFVARFVDVLNH